MCGAAGGIPISTAAAVPPLRRDTEDITDHELVARVRAGDDRAFECLYSRYRRRICAYVQGMVHDHARAEDVCQDVFMSALRRMRETDRPIAFKPWIYEIAKNACIDQFRRSRRAEVVSMDADDTLGSADYGKLVTKDLTPDAAVENKQQLDHLCGAFGGLSETHHQILVMRELEGLSYREIGERLGMTRPAVESTLFRARRRLGEEYDELVTGQRCQRVQTIIATAAQGALGVRDRKRLARHVSYCQPCLRQARLSGVDSGELVGTPLRRRIASLLPLPLVLKRRIAGDDGAPGEGSSLATWSAHASTLDPGLVSGWGKAAAAAATIALAGLGAGVATDPAEDARAALGGSIIERLGGADGADGDTALADPVAPVARQAGGRVEQPGGSSFAGARTADAERTQARDGSGSGDRADSGSGGDAGDPAGAGSTSASDGGSTDGSVVSKASEEAARTTSSGPVGDALSRLGVGGSTSGGGGSGGGSPSVDLPRVQLPAPDATSEPVGPTVESTTSGVTDAVTGSAGQAVQGATDAAESVTSTGQGILGGQ